MWKAGLLNSNESLFQFQTITTHQYLVSKEGIEKEKANYGRHEK